MWGYPEFYIPVPGGYGTEHGHRSSSPPSAAPAPAPAPCIERPDSHSVGGRLCGSQRARAQRSSYVT